MDNKNDYAVLSGQSPATGPQPRKEQDKILRRFFNRYGQ